MIEPSVASIGSSATIYLTPSFRQTLCSSVEAGGTSIDAGVLGVVKEYISGCQHYWKLKLDDVRPLIPSLSTSALPLAKYFRPVADFAQAIRDDRKQPEAQPEAPASLQPFCNTSPVQRRTVLRDVEALLLSHNVDPDILETGLVKGKAGRPRAPSVIVSREQASRLTQRISALVTAERPEMSEASRKQLLVAAGEKMLGTERPTPEAAEETASQVVVPVANSVRLALVADLSEASYAIIRGLLGPSVKMSGKRSTFDLVRVLLKCETNVLRLQDFRIERHVAPPRTSATTPVATALLGNDVDHQLTQKKPNDFGVAASAERVLMDICSSALSRWVPKRAYLRDGLSLTLISYTREELSRLHKRNAIPVIVKLSADGAKAKFLLQGSGFIAVLLSPVTGKDVSIQSVDSQHLLTLCTGKEDKVAYESMDALTELSLLCGGNKKLVVPVVPAIPDTQVKPSAEAPAASLGARASSSENAPVVAKRRKPSSTRRRDPVQEAAEELPPEVKGLITDDNPRGTLFVLRCFWAPCNHRADLCQHGWVFAFMCFTHQTCRRSGTKRGSALFVLSAEFLTKTRRHMTCYRLSGHPFGLGSMYQLAARGITGWCASSTSA